MGSEVAGYSTHRYDGVAQLFHWLIAIMIFVMFGLGWYMTDLDSADPRTFEIYQIHKGIGIAIFALALLRLLWRWTHPAPPLPATMKRWEMVAASAAHWALYGLILLQPLIGILQSNAANFPIVLFGSIELPALIGQNEALGETLTGLHHLFAKIMALLILAHIAAALRHHIMLKDDVLRRMMPGAAVGVAVIVLALGFTTPFFLVDKSVLAPATQVADTETEAPIAAEEAPAEDDTVMAEATPPAEADGSFWTVEEESTLGFIARQQGSPVPGNFDAFDAEILFNPDDLTNSRLSVDIDATSITTGHNDRDKMLNSPSFFDTEKWPDASFQSTRIVSAGDGLFGALGNLTIRDVTKRVTLPFTLEIKADPEDPSRELAHARGELPIMRLNYGIGQGDWVSTKSVADEVVITFDIMASRAK
jgi:cytochrome b561/polyisoprenoid-binding protein YceI